ncbi:chymotrypsin-2-like [Microplitis demolitor]|uniref:chymotrypsin-2-like n=1 Tax=Microplitis demolitor TaxID=69319 RepID=UPI0004CD5712|nr:chymotrypsin-2-like [Microplitis demolitor]
MIAAINYIPIYLRDWKFKMVSLISIVTNFVIFALIAINDGDGRSMARILEGTDAEPEKFPYMVSLRRWNNHVCGGAIISPRHILTAAHCFIGRADPPYTEGLVIVSSAAVNRYNGEIHQVKKVTPHSDYRKGTENRWRNDIAVVELKNDISENRYQKPIALPKADTPGNVTAVLSGWGQTTLRGEESDRLKQRIVRILPNDECNKKDADILDTNLCGFNGRGTGFCEGDSGSPLIHNNEIVGIVSFSILCGIGYPDSYTRVYKYLDFINSTMTGS